MAYLFCLDEGDHLDEDFKKTLYGDHRIIYSGHWPMVTKPKELVEAMLNLSA